MFSGCTKGTKTTSDKDAKTNDAQTSSSAAAGDDSQETLQGGEKIKVTMENGGNFIIELYPQMAPETCANFVSLVKSHFYDGLTFHRVVDNFMAQGGSKDGKGYEGSGKTIKGEFAANGFTRNTLKHTRGVVSMARATDPNSASSQFFICYEAKDFLDGNYAAFGKVIEGMEVVDDFCKVERTYNGTDSSPATPVEPIIIKSMEVI
ncbi:MAG: peptidylprolyl isomerase [Clostridia bacterium]|nr:peptidylprolyl isomerase [Clostridia bacterium]